MRLLGGRCGPLVALILGFSACQGAAPPHAHGGPTPTAAGPATADPQRCARLAKRGFTPCPPTADRLHLPPTTIRNATNGAIPDATAQTWGRAFQLAQAYYYWAMQNNARGALTSGVLADPSPGAMGNLFGQDLADLDSAKQAGGQLVFQPLSMPATQVVAIPASLQGDMQRQGLRPAPFGLAVRFTGPASRGIRLPDGTIRSPRSTGSDYAATGLVWGELRSDADLGTILFEFGSYGCDGEVRNVCQM
jgi:hypothetical protein